MSSYNSSSDLLENSVKGEDTFLMDSVMPGDSSPSELKKRDALIADLNKRVELLKLHHSDGILQAAELKKKILKLTAENDYLRGNVSRLRDERDTLRLSSKPFKDHEQVKTKLKAAENNIIALTTQLRNLQKENHRLEDYVARKYEK